MTGKQTAQGKFKQKKPVTENALSAFVTPTTLPHAVALHQAGRLVEAEAIYRDILRSAPSQPDALQLLGVIEKKKGNLAEAIALMEKAAILIPDAAPLLNNLGNAYRDAGNLDKASACYEKALAVDPTYAESLNNYGLVFLAQGATHKAAEKFLAAIAKQPKTADPYNNLGTAYHKQNLLAEAVANYRMAIELKPDFPEAHCNLGHAFVDMGNEEQAILCFREAVRLNPAYVEAWYTLLRQLQATCNWADYDSLCHRLHEFAITTGHVFPFAFLGIPSSSADQQQCARLWVQHQYRPYVDFGIQHPFQYPQRNDGKLRIGYLSSDLQNHATSSLMAEIFELHDSNRFETYAFSLGQDDGKEMRRRLQQAFDYFIDVSTLPYQDIAQLIHKEGIDILVDLKGYTKNTGSPVMAFRPAPVQVNYVGYPGTMGADFIDYLITDRFVTPPEVAPWYNETFAYLPDCYQPNDRQRKIGVMPSRAECDLPSDGIVFCCFNHTYKITPHLFRLWCRLLAVVPGSVLWLLKSNRWAQENLLREASLLGIDTKRLVFADVAPLEQHLARLQLADMFLDTLPVNAHTTASDALWAGVPVITCVGETFISRVAGSLLRAVDLPELVTDSLPDYEALALRLASEPAYLADIKARLKANRLTAPLFDSRTYTRNLEALYEKMWQRYRAGEKPAIIESDVAVEKTAVTISSALQNTLASETALDSRIVSEQVEALDDAVPINIVHIWHDQHKPIFDALLTQLEGALRDLKVRVSRTENMLLAGSVNILVGSTVFVAKQLREQIHGHCYVVYQMEPINDRSGLSGRFWPNPEYLALLEGAAWVWDYSVSNIAELTANGITRVSHVPLGYHHSLEKLDRSQIKDIDVLFYGSLTKRRIQALEALAAAGVKVRAAFGEYGAKLDELIVRSRIIVNIHHSDTVNTLEEVRISFLLANHCFVISEDSDHNPYDDGVVFCPYSRLAETCLKYLSVPEEVRQEIAEKGYKAIRRCDYTVIIKSAMQAMADVWPQQQAIQPAQATQPLYYRYARPEVVMLVPIDARTILDIGCAAGALGGSLKARRPCHVTGIELMSDAAAKAAQVLDKVISGDVFAALLRLPDEHFDAVIMADVLEHIANTDDVLRLVRRKLKPDGKLILSLPNVRHWSVVKDLLEGRWEYQDQGIMDRTHLKFFTRGSAQRTLARNGFWIEKTITTVVDGVQLPAGLTAVLKTFGIDAQDLDKDGLCYQYIFRCNRLAPA